MVNVVCIYWGTKYPTIYVQNLYNMVKRNLTVPFTFTCFTDHVKLQKLVQGDIRVRSMPYHNFKGWWNKMTLFSPKANLQGEILYLDLDLVILENIDCLLSFEKNKCCFINDFNKSKYYFNSSVMRFNNNIMTEHVWDPYVKHRNTYDKMLGDQNVITQLIKRTKHYAIYPDEWTFSYKWYDRKKPRYKKKDHTYELRPNTKIAVFHGKPNPHESTQEWVKNNWK